MPKVTVYTTQYCPYCVLAKELLKRKGVPFEEIDVGQDDELRAEVVRKSGRRTVPQVFIGEQSIGGFEELRALEDEGELEGLLGHS
jgi:glutaredoxin 3